MFKKTIIACLALLIAVFAFQPIEKAEARTRVHIGVGIGPGYGGYYGGYPYYGPGYYYAPPVPYYGGYYAPRRTYRPRRHARRISCRRARRIVRNRGYRNVRTIDCTGRGYSFLGRRRGRLYKISMRSRSGRITSISRYRRR